MLKIMYKKSLAISALSLSALSTLWLPTTLATSTLLVAPKAHACTPYQYLAGLCTLDDGPKFDESPVVRCALPPGEYEFCPEDEECGDGTTLTETTIIELTESQCLANGGTVIAIVNQ